MAIDNALRNVGLQRIVNYSYIVGDCLFDFISYLLHGIVCNITLQKGFCWMFATSLNKKRL